MNMSGRDCRGLFCNNPQVDILTFDETEDEYNNNFDILGNI